MWEYLAGFYGLLRALSGIRFFLIKRKVNSPAEIFPQAQPFFNRAKSGKIALFLHGFTSSPREFRDLGKYLYKRDISCYAPLLPGHGTSPERLAVIKQYQWTEFVQEQISMLAKDYEEIYLIGSSFGGNLALISSNYSPKIKGIATIGTPIIFRKHRFNRYFVLPLLRRIKIFQKKPKRVRDFIDTHKGSYKIIPLRAAYEMSKIVDISKKNLVNVNKPIIVMYVKNDSVVSEASHKIILNNISSKNKAGFEIPESNHVALLGKHANVANKQIANFIKTINI